MIEERDHEPVNKTTLDTERFYLKINTVCTILEVTTLLQETLGVNTHVAKHKQLNEQIFDSECGVGDSFRTVRGAVQTFKKVNLSALVLCLSVTCSVSRKILVLLPISFRTMCSPIRAETIDSSGLSSARLFAVYNSLLSINATLKESISRPWSVVTRPTALFSILKATFDFLFAGEYILQDQLHFFSYIFALRAPSSRC